MTPEDRHILRLTCAECEEHLADLIDETLSGEQKAAVESHLVSCADCMALAQDARAAMTFAGKAADVELPATLVPRILAEITTGPSRVLVQAPLAERIFGRWIRPILQPRFALSVAMAALSVALIPRIWPEATNPARIWTMAENRIYRTYDRAVKNYEDLAVVANVESQIDELRDVDGLNRDGNNDEAPDSGRGGRLR
jgi:hypothetical protein